jgi:hypothetical protein
MPLLSLRRRDFAVGRDRFVQPVGPRGASDSLIFAALARGLFNACANPRCRSGWLHLWRHRATPVFEGGWTCSRACTEVRVESAIRRELDGRSWTSRDHRHRIPLGLVMLEQGWISSEQLRRALTAQRATGRGPLGWWLVQQKAASDLTVARALALQWSCPVLSADAAEASSLTAALPRLFVDAFATVPLRLAAGQVLYLGCERRPDPVLALGVAQITGLRVESGIVVSSQFVPAQQRVLETAFPLVELLEAANVPAAARALSRAIERVQPVEARLARMHDCLWLRMWCRVQSAPLPPLDSIEDLICSLGAS